MRIQHNILAMNAYRNYNTNTSALAKNLEKLSSGYKINRAGDDAAGLAISEKMRAQITGLNAASKNVKDGISLVKTAEGAMQEIQDMLNRMDYLATQSANGTYDDETDRAALQKEVEQLKSEINRIADSANFNGINLLNGKLDGSDDTLKAAEAAKTAAQAALNSAKADLKSAQNLIPAGEDDKWDAEKIKEILVGKGATSSNAGSVGQATILESDATESGAEGFNVSLDGVNYISDGSGAATAKITLKIGDATLTITEEDIKEYLEAQPGGEYKEGMKIGGAKLAEIFANKYSGTQTFEPGGSSSGEKYKITADGTKLKFVAADGKTLNRHYDVSISASLAPSAPKDAQKATFSSGAITKGSAASGDTVTLTLNYSYVDDNGTLHTDGTKTVSFSLAGTVNGAATIGAIMNDLVNQLKNDSTLGNLFDVSWDGTNLKIDAKAPGTVDGSSGATTGFVAGAAGSVSISFSVNNSHAIGWATGNETMTKGVDSYTAGLGNSYTLSTGDIVTGDAAKGDILASTEIDLSELLKNAESAEGFEIKIGDQTFRITTSKDSEYYKKAQENGGMYNGAKVILIEKEKPDAADLVSAITREAAGNTKFHVEQGTDPGKLRIKQLDSARQNNNFHLHDMESFLDEIGITVVSKAGSTAAKDQAIAEAQAKVDEAQAKYDKAAARVEEVKSKPGKSLQLQIGDTSDDYNQMQVNIKDMHTDSLGIAELSIKNAQDAADAISVIKAAINNVSSVRGDLGAYQNRLEHTANNLSVMAENIQDAESTIRDTDIAEEMMAYTKNNILIQSAQAMLAQANAIPQGVLQLLG